MTLPEKMTDSQIEHWLDKTGRSIRAAIRRGSFRVDCNQPAQRLIDRYDTLRGEARKPERGGLWKRFCEARGFCTAHTGFDCAC